MEVPWSRGHIETASAAVQHLPTARFESAQDRDGTLAAYASYASHLDVLVENLKELKDPSGQFNWELQNSLEREKGRLRGVLESLGPAAYQPFALWQRQSLSRSFASFRHEISAFPRCRKAFSKWSSRISRFTAASPMLQRRRSSPASWPLQMETPWSACRGPSYCCLVAGKFWPAG